MNKSGRQNMSFIRWLTFLMFMMFAMTTDSVGVIIPQIVKEFGLSLTAAGAFHYATMAAIAISAVLLGFLADRFGRKQTIVLGLTIFAVISYLFVLGNSFAYFLCLLAISGVSIGIFKTGALALIGDISSSTTEHTSTMNLVEGFFGVGAIIGPAIVTSLINHDVSWKWLYAIAGTLCAVLILIALAVRYPRTMQASEESVDLRRTLRMMRNPYALAFGSAVLLYVAIEASVYVWGPLYLADYRGPWALLAAYAISVFFLLRAAGRFLGGWMLAKYDWSWVLAFMSLAILLCLGGSAFGGVRAGVVLLPLSGLFMSVIYPTLNSKGISCFQKSEHGAVAGVILFFTCGGAVLGPLAMAAVIDALDSPKYAFSMATLFAALLLIGLLYNCVRQPTRGVLLRQDAREYGVTMPLGA
ncbi:MAG: MFS transporter [Pseudomonadota bacterium]|nr:MFS transporter [Pseudomonadota bacterium]